MANIKYLRIVKRKHTMRFPTTERFTDKRPLRDDEYERKARVSILQQFVLARRSEYIADVMQSLRLPVRK